MKITLKDIFDKETGFFRFLIDKQCFKKKAARLAKKYLPSTCIRELISMAKHAYQLQDGTKEELLIEIARRFDRQLVCTCLMQEKTTDAINHRTTLKYDPLKIMNSRKNCILHWNEDQNNRIKECLGNKD